LATTRRSPLSPSAEGFDSHDNDLATYMSFAGNKTDLIFAVTG
jgi:hypothetical protein